MTPNRKRRPLAHDLDWNLLRCFLVIGQQGSISRAAAVLHRTQPAVSAALKRLEQQIGKSLAWRSATKFQLTGAGEILFQECEEIFNTIANVPDLLDDEGDWLVGTLSLMMASHIVSDLIDRALAEFHRRYPRVTIDITISPSSKTIEATLSKSHNIGVCLASVKHPDLHYEHLYREHFGFFCGRGHRLFGKRKLTIKDLEGEQAVSFRVFAFSDWVQTIGALNKQANLAVPMVGISDNLEEIRRLLLANVGIGALPIHVMERDVKDGVLWQLPPYETAPAVDVYLVTNPHARLGRTEVAFVQLLLATVAAVPLSGRTYPAESRTVGKARLSTRTRIRGSNA